MSKESIAWAMKITGLPIAEKSILSQLAILFSAEKGYAWPGKATLNLRTGVSVRHITRVTQALERKGFIWVQHCFIDYDNPRPRQISNRYYLPLFDPESAENAKLAGKSVYVTPTPNYDAGTIEMLREDEW